VYNLYVITIGFICPSYSMQVCYKLPPGDDLVESIALVAGLVFANFGYSLYLIYEILLRAKFINFKRFPRNFVFYGAFYLTTVAIL